MRKPKILWIFSLSVQGNKLAEDTLLNLEAGWKLWQTGLYDYVLLVGGVFDAGQTIPVAWLMWEWWNLKLSADEMANPDPQILVEAESVTTTQNVLLGEKILTEQGWSMKQCQHTVVSEWWHTIGIAVLIWRLYFVFTYRQQSGQHLDRDGLQGRLKRIIYYLWDPYGTGKLAQREVAHRQAMTALALQKRLTDSS